MISHMHEHSVEISMHPQRPHLKHKQHQLSTINVLSLGAAGFGVLKTFYLLGPQRVNTHAVVRDKNWKTSLKHC